MNNKFIKRVAAVVLGVAVLSTCAFAASVTNGSYSDKLYFTLDTTQDKVSYIAYASDAESSVGTIVAIGQIDNDSDNTEALSIPVSASLLGDASHILIKSGDSAGGAASELLIPAAAYTHSVTCTEATGVYGDIHHAPQYKISVKVNKDGSLVLNSLTAKTEGYEDHALGTIGTLKAITDTTFASGATLEVNFVLAGAPEAQVAAGIELVPDFTFTAAN